MFLKIPEGLKVQKYMQRYRNNMHLIVIYLQVHPLSRSLFRYTIYSLIYT